MDILDDQYQRAMARRLEAHVVATLRKKTKDIRFFRTKTEEAAISTLDADQVELGQLLGEGSFSEALEIVRVGPRLPSATTNDDASNNISIKDDTQIDFAHTSNSTTRFVLKRVRRELGTNPKKFHDAVVGLVLESEYLSRLDHPNIIKLRAVSEGGVTCIGERKDFFLILDRVNETLADRMKGWHREAKTSDTLEQGGHLGKQIHCYQEKVSYALQIARALEYLHSKDILFRDLKPGNIGLIGDTVQLFDFGLSGELPKACPKERELFRMSRVGTRRYMAPEVYLRQPYNAKADVYSWAIVFHEMMSLTKAYATVDADIFELLVCIEGVRPRINEDWPIRIQHLLVNGWAQRALKRPTMSTIREKLESLTESLARKIQLPSEETSLQSLTYSTPFASTTMLLPSIPVETLHHSLF
jgi:serine/threonine protein kinase